mmetsp:Transcript_56793/g.112808  ORF Transcript_56793/g.112808 Transcript_56793/m.112808 type:complete len:322 (-) Transcript_56793:190-1155(-)
MQDPYLAVKEEVESTLSVVVDLHKKWLRLDRKSDEFEWTSSELLSGLRSIEWDLQDLEDTVSIVEGNTLKFQLAESDIEERKKFIEATRKSIVMMRDEVQGSVQGSSDSGGFSTSSGSNSAIPGTKKSKGYGKIALQEDPRGTTEALPLPPADEDVESAKPAAASPSDAADEILGAELESLDPHPSRRRHRKKKACLTAVLLLVVAGIAAATLSGSASPAAASTPSSSSPSSATSSTEHAAMGSSLPLAAAAADPPSPPPSAAPPAAPLSPVAVPIVEAATPAASAAVVHERRLSSVADDRGHAADVATRPGRVSETLLRR